MRKHPWRKHPGPVKTFSFILAAFVAVSILILWSWNTLAADLFLLPEARFKHAVALEALMVGVFLVSMIIARFTLNGAPRSGSQGESAS